MIQNLYS